MMNQPPLDGPVSATVDRALSSAMDLYGPSLLREPARLRLYLQTQCPAAAREIGAVMAAVVEGVPQAMLATHSDEEIEALLPTLIDRLAAKLPIKGAEWAIRAWAHALAVSTRVLDAPSGRSPSATTVMSSQRSNAAEVLGIGRAVERVVVPQVPKTMPPEAASVAAPLMPETSSIEERVSTPEPALMPEVTSTSLPIEMAVPIVLAEPAADPEPIVVAPVELASVEPARDTDSTSVEVSLPEVLPMPIPMPVTLTEPIAAIEVPLPAPVETPVIETIAVEPEPVAAVSLESPSAIVEEPSSEVFVAQSNAETILLSAPTPIDAPSVPVHQEPLIASPQQAAIVNRAPRHAIGRIAVIAAIVAAVIVVLAMQWTSLNPPAPAVVATASTPVGEELKAPPTPEPATRPSEVPAPSSSASTSTDYVATPPSTTPDAATSAPASAAALTNDVASKEPPIEPPPAPVPVPVAVSQSAPVAPEVPATARPESRSKKALKPTTTPRTKDAKTSTKVIASASAAKSKATERETSGCTRSTCGSVVAFHPVDGTVVSGQQRGTSQAPPSYEMTVRMDDRSIHTLVLPSRLQPGTRVRMKGTRLAPF